MPQTFPVIKLPDGTKCYSGPNCRVHGPAIAAAAATAPIASPEAFELALKQADQAEPARPTEVLSKGLAPRPLTAGEPRRYADLLRSGDKGARVVTSVDISTPPGYFIVSTRMLGITTEYLAQGDEGDRHAPLVGRIELSKSRGRIYRGSELKGGEYIGSIGGSSDKTFADAFDDIALGPEPLPVAPASTPGVFGLPNGTFSTYSPYDINNYTASTGIALREVHTNGEFKKAIKQVRSEPLGVVRVVRARFNKNHGSFGLSDKPVVAGPKDGTPLVIDMGRGYTDLEVASGNVVINAEGIYGGGVTVREGAAVTIITPPGKFTVHADAGSAVTVFPRSGARGGVWSEEGANVVIDNTHAHSIENHVRSRSRR